MRDKETFALWFVFCFVYILLIYYTKFSILFIFISYKIMKGKIKLFLFGSLFGYTALNTLHLVYP